MADVTEQSARLNTLMRFHQYADALPFAYKYRLDLQLSLPKSAQVDKALRSVEEIIDSLERQESRAMKLGKFIWGFVVNDRPAPAEDVLLAPVELEAGSETDSERHAG